VDSDPTSTKKTAEIRRSAAPDRSSATTVSSNVGEPGRATIAATSARCSAIATSNASAKCSSWIAVKSGK
jgi:hypothetical protein